MENTVAHHELKDAVIVAGLGVDASELHGLLVGYVCGGATIATGQTLASLGLEVEHQHVGDELADLLEILRRHCVRELGDLDMGLQPLLPGDQQPLPERVDALLEWTRGFLGGFGLAGVDATLLTADGKEVLRDLATIAATDPTLDDAVAQAGDDDESAWMELVEFVRVGGMMLHAELAAASSRVRKGHA